MNEEETIDLTYGYLIAAFRLLGDADLFDEMCDDVSVLYDEWIEELDEEEYAENIVRLCNGK